MDKVVSPMLLLAWVATGLTDLFVCYPPLLAIHIGNIFTEISDGGKPVAT
jgi:hypothetical protein